MEELCNNAQISIFWDIFKCPIPREVETRDLKRNILKALQLNMFNGDVDQMFAYADYAVVARSVAKRLEKSDMELINTPDETRKVINNDLIGFLDGNHSPAVIMLISREVDFSETLYLLGCHEYTIIYVTMFVYEAPLALRKACSYVWDWSDVANGYSGWNMQVISPMILPCSGNLTDLKEQLEELLEACYGHVPYGSFQSEYIKKFGSPLYFSEYGASNLEDLILILSDVVQIADQIEGQGDYWRCVSLKKWKTIGVRKLESCSKDDPRNLMNLRDQLVELIEACGGHLPYGRLCSEFQKRFKRPLCPSEYGTSDLECLLRASNIVHMEDQVTGQDGYWRCVSLKKSKTM